MAKPRRSKRLSGRRGPPSYVSPDPPRVQSRTAKAEREATRLKNGGKPKRYFFTAPEDDKGRDMRRKRKRPDSYTDSGYEGSGSTKTSEGTPERTPKVARTGEHDTPAPHGAFMPFELPSTPVPKRVASTSEASDEVRFSSGGATKSESDDEFAAEPNAPPVVTPTCQTALRAAPRLRARRSGAPPPFTTPTIRVQPPGDHTPGPNKADDEGEVDDEDFWTSPPERSQTLERHKKLHRQLRASTVTRTEAKVESGDAAIANFEELVAANEHGDVVPTAVSWEEDADGVLPATYAASESGDTYVNTPPAMPATHDDVNMWDAYCNGLGRPTEADMARVPSRPRGLWPILNHLFSAVTPALTESVSRKGWEKLTDSTASSSA